MSDLRCYNCHQPVTPEHHVCPHCGSTLLLRDKYRIQSVLGQGGFGCVYEAIEIDLNNRRCAIKEVIERPPTLRKQQIEQEVAVLAHVSGQFPFIPDIYARWSTELKHFIVMQYVDGRTVDRVRSLPWSSEDVLRFVRDLLDHLVQLHAAAVVHRDIKPLNIKYAARRGYVLLDFGLATKGSNTIIQGRSPDYAPPEQFYELRSATTRTDPRSDLYSLAATAYYLLTGIPPTRADLRKKGQPLLPPRHHDGVPHVLEQTLLQMLELDPERRPASAQHALALLDISDRTTRKFWTDPIEDGPSTDPEQSTPPGGVPPESSTYLRACQGQGRINSLAWAPDGQQLAIASSLGVSLYTPATGQEERFQDMPVPVQYVAYALDGAALAFALHNTVQLWKTQPRQLLRSLDGSPTGTDGFVAFACAAHGPTLAVASEKEVVLWNIPDDRQIGTIAAEVVMDGLALSADGMTLALVLREGIGLWQLRSGVLRAPRTLKPPGHVLSIAFSHDGQTLVAVTSSTVAVWRVGDGQPLCTIKEHTGLIVSAALAPDGRTVALATEGGASLWQVNGPRRLRTLDGPLRGLRQVVFAPEGEQVAGSSHERVWVWQTRDGAAVATLEEHLDSVRSIAFSADGQLLAAIGGCVRVWQVHETTLSLRLTLEGPSDDQVGVAFDPSGQLLAAASKAGLRVWQVADGTPVEELAGQAGQAHSVAFADEGRTLLNVGLDAVQRWRVGERTMEPMLEQHLAQGYDVALTPNGEWLATFRERAIQVWRSDGRLERELEVDVDINSVALTPNGQRLAVVGDEATQVWQLEEKPRLLGQQKLGGHRVVFAPDGEQLALLHETMIRLWRWRAGTRGMVGPLEGHTDIVTDVAFAPAGRLLASASEDGTVRLWGWKE